MRRSPLFVLLGLVACTSSTGPDAEQADAGLATDFGVDAAAKVLRIGTLNDESGPGAAIGKPYAIGKRVLAGHINDGGSGLLPEGWTVELVERDHGYNPQKSVASYKEIKGEVLFIGTGFGTPNTLPLRPMLQADNLVAFPASLSSAMAENAYTPPLAPSYAIEAQRALEHAVHTAGDASAVKAAIVYQQDDYGKDGLDGLRKAAKATGVSIVSEQTVAPGQKDVTAVVSALKEAGATHVLLTTLPSATGPILGTAAQLQFGPTWYGNTPAWIDRFFDPNVIPSAVFGRFYYVNGLPFWGEDLEGMHAFEAAFEAHGGGAAPDSYTLQSYIQGLVEVDIARQAIEAGDATRQAYLDTLRTTENLQIGEMMQPLTLTSLPYAAGTQVRVLKPDYEARSWTVVADYAGVGDPFAPDAQPTDGAEAP